MRHRLRLFYIQNTSLNFRLESALWHCVVSSLLCALTVWIVHMCFVYVCIFVAALFRFHRTFRRSDTRALPLASYDFCMCVLFLVGALLLFYWFSCVRTYTHRTNVWRKIQITTENASDPKTTCMYMRRIVGARKIHNGFIVRHRYTTCAISRDRIKSNTISVYYTEDLSSVFWSETFLFDHLFQLIKLMQSPAHFFPPSAIKCNSK